MQLFSFFCFQKCCWPYSPPSHVLTCGVFAHRCPLTTIPALALASPTAGRLHSGAMTWQMQLVLLKTMLKGYPRKIVQLLIDRINKSSAHRIRCVEDIFCMEGENRETGPCVSDMNLPPVWQLTNRNPCTIQQEVGSRPTHNTMLVQHTSPG